ncbi:hypothetical protein [Luteimonas sp. FCS-9]|uniref:hypothetical protein n=1 Tax=Luteimonas sp. FCS-9 TaxID=1547516 RepID=UPI00063EBD21|nr:hypothetical protein [Luteimonas sp. FCS-9]KLI98724.1 hypothetical protein WQ56_14430 [Luteimonas sp. FCS-9]
MSAATLGRALIVAGGVASVAAVATALLLIGSPSAQRQARLDATRVHDLLRIEQAAMRQLARDGALPATPAAIDAPDLRRADPDTGAPYGYRVLAPDRVELCAHFAVDNRDPLRQVEPWLRAEWPHGPGRACFARRVDGQAVPAAPAG